MTTPFPRVTHPELFFGLVAPIGTDISQGIIGLRDSLSRLGYTVKEIKVTDIYQFLSKYITPTTKLEKTPESERYTSHIKYGNQLRQHFKDNAFLAYMAIAQIARRRASTKQPEDGSPNTKIAYIINQLKRNEEVELLRSLYGSNFFQISIYSRKGARVQNLAAKFASTAKSSSRDRYLSKAEEIIQIDLNEKSNKYGQRIIKIFHDADVIFNADIEKPSIIEQSDRFIRLLFGSNSISPNRLEYGMFIAKAAALRTLDLSRQVGAAIFSQDGEIITMGSNEVPKGTGGTYWCDEAFDDREYKRGFDANETRKNGALHDLLHRAGLSTDVTDDILESQFMDVLEYGRIIHAEMSAIVDAARIGRSTKDSILYCTTFPCHMCAKHIVGSGIKSVIYLEPYPKSLVFELHSDSVDVEGNDRGKYKNYNSVKFEHFYGIAPRRYRELFERQSRKNNGEFVEWKYNEPMPNIETHLAYIQIEKVMLETVVTQYASQLSISEDDMNKALDDPPKNGEK